MPRVYNGPSALMNEKQVYILPSKTTEVTGDYFKPFYSNAHWRKTLQSTGFKVDEYFAGVVFENIFLSHFKGFP